MTTTHYTDPTQNQPDIHILNPVIKAAILEDLKQKTQETRFFQIAQIAAITSFTYAQIYAALQYGIHINRIGTYQEIDSPTRYFFK